MPMNRLLRDMGFIAPWTKLRIGDEKKENCELKERCQNLDSVSRGKIVTVQAGEEGTVSAPSVYHGYIRCF